MINMNQAKNHPLFTPYQIGAHQLMNRTVVAPMTRNSASARGIPTQQMEAYYLNFAKGGFGMIITEGIYTDEIASRANLHQPGIVSTEQQHAWAELVSGMKVFPVKFICQLMHAGALSELVDHSQAPSAVQPLGDYSLPKKMTLSDFEIARRGFVNAAMAAERCGFDGVELHSANGYLLDQMITDYTNLREDEYGGTMENRFRLLNSIVMDIEAATKENFIIGLRLSESKVNDLTYRMPGGADDARRILREAAKLPLSYIHIAAEGGIWERECRYPDGSSYGSLARELCGIPVIVNGGMHDVELGRWILENGHGDLLSIGRAAIADPHWPQKIQSGDAPVFFNKAMIKPSLTLSNTMSYFENLQNQVFSNETLRR